MGYWQEITLYGLPYTSASGFLLLPVYSYCRLEQLHACPDVVVGVRNNPVYHCYTDMPRQDKMIVSGLVS